MGWNRFRRSSEEMHGVVASATNESKHFGTERQLQQQGSRGVISSPAIVKVGNPNMNLHFVELQGPWSLTPYPGIIPKGFGHHLAGAVTSRTGTLASNRFSC